MLCEAQGESLPDSAGQALGRWLQLGLDRMLGLDMWGSGYVPNLVWRRTKVSSIALVAQACC